MLPGATANILPNFSTLPLSARCARPGDLLRPMLRILPKAPCASASRGNRPRGQPCLGRPLPNAMRRGGGASLEIRLLTNVNLVSTFVIDCNLGDGYAGNEEACGIEGGGMHFSRSIRRFPASNQPTWSRDERLDPDSVDCTGKGMASFAECVRLWGVDSGQSPSSPWHLRVSSVLHSRRWCSPPCCRGVRGDARLASRESRRCGA